MTMTSYHCGILRDSDVLHQAGHLVTPTISSYHHLNHDMLPNPTSNPRSLLVLPRPLLASHACSMHLPPYVEKRVVNFLLLVSAELELRRAE